MRSYYLLLVIAMLCSLSITVTVRTNNLIWPLPTNFTSDNEGLNISITPCEIRYIITAPSPQMIQQIIDLYLIQVFKCAQAKPKVNMTIAVKDSSQTIATAVKHEKYQLTLRDSLKWDIQADYYVGFLRGFQTFSQLFEYNETSESYDIHGLPITIDDQPEFVWRGIMIDSSRHFMPIELIKKTIDGMLYSKLNVLHWHITDQDSFPIYIPSRPELSQYGSINGVYSVIDVKSIIAYANIRGVRVVPEIDTPAHTESWGRSQKYKQITLNCNGQYEGQFDPTLPLTMEVVKDVLIHMNTTFVDNYVHFGGDQVVYKCWDKRPSIADYMKANNISDYKGLTVDFRQKQKKQWRNISATKKVIYWANQQIDLPLENDDVIQWWGVSANVAKMAGRKNQVILSNYDLTYLDIGFGNRYGNSYGYYQNWRKMYNFQPKITNVNVIGGQTCMWNQIGTQYTHEQKVFLRANILGERLWNQKIDIKTKLNNIATRLIAQAARLRARGFKISPVTVGLCEKEVSLCFP